MNINWVLVWETYASKVIPNNSDIDLERMHFKT